MVSMPSPGAAPQPLPIHPDSIPATLRTLPNWVVWRYELNADRNDWTKVPYIPGTSRRASSTNPKTWRTFEQALQEYQAGRCSGVGFMLPLDKSLTGGDLDDCVDPITGIIADWAQVIIDAADTYTELSPSGAGVRFVALGTLPASKRKGPRELYASARYLTMTGHHLPGTPDDVREADVDALHQVMFGDTAPAVLSAHRTAGPVALDDLALLEKARQSGHGAEFSALYDRGDTSGHGDDDSAADLALCNRLKFWTGGDAGRMDRLFRGSALYRPKWDERRGEQTYGWITIQKSLASGGEVYTGRSSPVRIGSDGSEAASDTDDSQPGGPDGYRLTDLGNAGRFAALHVDVARFCYQRDQWLLWDGCRWKPDDTGAVLQLARGVVMTMYRTAAIIENPDQRKALVDHARRSEAENRIKAMVSLARTETALQVHPKQLDATPYLLNTLSGTLDLRTGELRPHCREDFLTMLAPAYYDPNASHPAWDKYRAGAFGGDTDLERYIQRAIGYSACGDPAEEVILLVLGPGRSGKSTLMDAMRATLGEYAASVDFETFLARSRLAVGAPRPDLAGLAGKRVVVSVETNDATKLAVGLVKQISGRDPITARFLFGRDFTYEPAFVLWLVTNEPPKMPDHDDAFWARLKRLPFDRVIPKEERDPTVKAALKNDPAARAAVLRWIVDGAVAWVKDGLGETPRVEQATAELRQTMDPLAEFWAEECVFQPGVRVSNADLYRAIKNWFEQHGQKPQFNTKHVALQLRQRGCELAAWNHKSTRGWKGVALVADGYTPQFEDESEGDGGREGDAKVLKGSTSNDSRRALMHTAVPQASPVPPKEREEFEL